ncbi:MAG: hypothetical protein JNL88_13715 [Bacteroidia bacterium]|nr:hypothetical protein [Bacteroidia bacterium]
MSEGRPTQEPTFQLFRLPKEKPVLDFVLQKLGEGASPERYELLESLLSMYRTSAGFDPYAMSKGRFKRLKAAAFRQTLNEIDREIGLLIESPGYLQYLQRESDFAPLFKEYLELVQGIGQHPFLSLTGELESFEQKCTGKEAEDLLLLFYRQQPLFLEAVHRKDGPESFLEKYDRILDRQQNLQRQFRLGFELLALEQAADRGLHDRLRSEEILNELGTLLTREKSTAHQYPLLLNIIRASLLTSSPARNLSPYLGFIEDSARQLFFYAPDARRMVLTILAQYQIGAGREKRLLWLEEAEKEARQLELHDERPRFRFIRCMIEADAGDIEGALKCLNEAEHLVFKASNRSLAARNNWVRLCEYRSLLFTWKALQGDPSYLDQMPLLQQMAEDMGRHRNEIAVMILEWKGLQSFLQQDSDSALHYFEKARGYRKNSEARPWLLIDQFFCGLLGKGKKKNSMAEAALHLEQICEPFYSSVGGGILKLAAVQTEKVTK